MQATNVEARRRRILLLFVLGIVVPCLLLGYLAYRGVQNDRALLEQRTIERHRRSAAFVTESIQNEIQAAEASYAAAVAAQQASLQSSSTGFLDTLKARFPLIQEVFFIDNADIRFPAARFLYSPSADRVVTGQPGPATLRLMQEAQQDEFQRNDLPRALAIYQQAFAQATFEPARAEAFNAIARVQRKLMRIPEAIDSYRRLGEKWRHVRLASGMPLGLIAGLELGALHLVQKDTLRATETLLGLYQSLVNGEWSLEKAHYDFFAQRTSTLIHELFAGAVSPTLRASQNLFIMLKTREQTRLASTEKLLAFGQSAASLLREKISRFPLRPQGRPSRLALDINGRSYLVSLLHVPNTPATWGLLFDENVLKTRILLTATQLITLENVQWVVTDKDGQVLSKLAQPAGAQLSVRRNFGGNFPPWSLELYQQEPLLLQTLITSRHGVYLYIFVLIGIILLFGLAVTLRSIEHELELSKMKSDFVSAVSHDFKSPLTSIRQLAEMLQSNRVPSELRRRQYYDVIVEQSERLARLVDNVLDFSKMEEGRRSYSFEVTDLGELLRHLVSRFQLQVDHAGFRIDAEIPDHLPSVRADRLAVSEAISNLLDNAIKYSGGADHVELRAYAENRHLVIAVQDFGIGIDKKELPKIFDRFYRGVDASAQSIEGAGLGLALVKHIALAHHGTVEVDSAPGRGSTFYLRLPIAD